MKQVTLNIPENKFQFFIELTKQLGLEIQKEETLDVNIPQWQQELTLKRLEELDKDKSKSIDFDDMINRLEDKYGL